MRSIKFILHRSSESLNGDNSDDSGVTSTLNISKFDIFGVLHPLYKFVSNDSIFRDSEADDRDGEPDFIARLAEQYPSLNQLLMRIDALNAHFNSELHEIHRTRTDSDGSSNNSDDDSYDSS